MITTKFHTNVGFCILSWADVEQELFQICSASLGTTEQRAAIVYYRTPTLDARLTLTDELLLTVLPKPSKKNGGHPHEDVKAWNEIREEIRDGLGTRNRIAHHPVNIMVDFQAEGSRPGIWLQSHMSRHERARGRKVPARPLREADLSLHGRQVQKMIFHLRKFRKDVLAKHVPKPAERPTSPRPD